MLNMKRTFFAVALMACVASTGSAQKLTPKETLRATYSDSGALPKSASCSSKTCFSTPATIYSYSLVCPVPAGSTCRYDIQIAGQVESGGNSIVSGEVGAYQFLVDGSAPSGGGTDLLGFYDWQIGGPEFVFGTSYNVHSKVSNSVANQKHKVTVNLACGETIGDPAGCHADAPFQTLVVRVWTP